MTLTQEQNEFAGEKTALADREDGQERQEKEAALLRGLLQIYSPSGEEAEASAWLVEQMKTLGLKARVDEADNAVGEIGSGPIAVMLLGHIDTVPGFIPVVTKDGVLHGRGAVDAKGPLAAFTAAVARLAGDELLQERRIVVVGAVEEEVASSKGAHHILEYYDEDRPANLIIGEPSGWNDITLGYKGRLLVEATLSRRMQHTARTEGSAVEDGVDLWNALRREVVEPFNSSFNAAGHKRTSFETLDPSFRRFDTVTDGFHEEVHLLIGFRLPLDYPAGEVISFFKEYQAKLPEEIKMELTISGEEHAYRGARNTALVRAFLAAVRGQKGEPHFKVKTGTSDLNVIAPIWQIPALAYGPGDSSFDHTPNEQISLAEYAHGVDVLEAVLRRMLAHETRPPESE